MLEVNLYKCILFRIRKYMVFTNSVYVDVASSICLLSNIWSLVFEGAAECGCVYYLIVCIGKVRDL